MKGVWNAEERKGVERKGVGQWERKGVGQWYWHISGETEDDEYDKTIDWHFSAFKESAEGAGRRGADEFSVQEIISIVTTGGL